MAISHQDLDLGKDAARGASPSPFLRELARRGESLAALLLALFLAGFHWYASEHGLGNRQHRGLFWRLILPVLLLVAGPAVVRLLSRSPIARLAAALVGWLALSPVWGSGPIEVTPRAVWIGAGWTLAFFLGAAALFTRERRELLRAILAAAASLSAAAAIVGFAGGRSFEGLGRLYGAVQTDHPNMYAQAMGFAALLALDRLLAIEAPRGLRLLAWSSALALLVGALFLTRGRLALLAFAAAVTVALLLGRNRGAVRLAFGLVAAAVALAGAAVPDLVSGIVRRGDAGRAFIYEDLWHRLAGHRLLGMGLGASDNVQFPPGSGDFPAGATIQHAHSLFVGTLYFGGLVGAALLVLIVVRAARRGFAIAAAGDSLPLTLLAFGVGCLSLDGPRAVSGPFVSTWLLFWLPVALVAGSEADTDPRPEAAIGRERPQTTRSSPVPALLLVGLAFTLVAWRLGDLGKPLRKPAIQRQERELEVVRRLASEGFDLSRPTAALASPNGASASFPLPEALAALVWRQSAGSLPAVRLVYLLFFCGSALCFHRLAGRFVGRGAAPFATVAYLALPFGIVASTACIPHGLGLLLTLAAALAIAGGRRRSAIRWAGGTALGALALLVAPGLVVPWVAVFVATLARERRRRRLSIGSAALLAGIPILLALAWQLYVTRVVAPTSVGSPLAVWERLGIGRLGGAGGLAVWLQSSTWLALAERLVAELVGPALLLPVVAGAILAVRRRRHLLGMLAAGTALYLAIFVVTARPGFELLAALPVTALLAGLALERIGRSTLPERIPGARWIAAACLVAVAIGSGLASERSAGSRAPAPGRGSAGQPAER